LHFVAVSVLGGNSCVITYPKRI